MFPANWFEERAKPLNGVLADYGPIDYKTSNKTGFINPHKVRFARRRNEGSGLRSTHIHAPDAHPPSVLCAARVSLHVPGTQGVQRERVVHRMFTRDFLDVVAKLQKSAIGSDNWVARLPRHPKGHDQSHFMTEQVRSFAVRTWMRGGSDAGKGSGRRLRGQVVWWMVSGLRRSARGRRGLAHPRQRTHTHDVPIAGLSVLRPIVVIRSNQTLAWQSARASGQPSCGSRGPRARRRSGRRRRSATPARAVLLPAPKLSARLCFRRPAV